MEENKLNKSNKIKVIVLTALLFLIAISGITYAYFSIQIVGNEEASSIRVTTANLKLIYTYTLVMSGEKIYPGWSETKTITVENAGNQDVYYSIIWRELLNEITNNELVISASCTSSINGNTCEGISEKVIPTKTSLANNVLIKYGISIEVGETHTYQVTVIFKETGSVQNYNQNKEFYGTLNIADGNSLITDVSYFHYNIKSSSVSYNINMTTCKNYMMTEMNYAEEEATNYCNKDSGAEITVEQELLNNNIQSSDYTNYGLSNVEFSGGQIKITGYNTAGGSDVIIPSTINGLPVTEIGVGTFYNKGLTSLVIPEGVTTIAGDIKVGGICPNGNVFQGAFADNHLTSITIPSSVTEIYGGGSCRVSFMETAKISGPFEGNPLTSVIIKGKSSSSDFNVYGDHIWGWSNDVTCVTDNTSNVEGGCITWEGSGS